MRRSSSPLIRNATYTAKTFKGLEEVLATELEELGARRVKVGRRAVYFEGNKELLYKANLSLYTALNILKPIVAIDFTSEDEFYRKLYDIPWMDFFGVEQSFAIKSTVFSDLFKHTQFPALRLKDAIADAFRDKIGQRPSVDVEQPDIRLDLYISENKATISLDSSGDPLFKRGYRLDGWKAPLNEVLAAGMIKLSEWDQNSEFHNPMCGSGTLAIEAAMMASNRPANYRRARFGFHNWTDYDDQLWKRVYSESMELVDRALPFPIIANDLEPMAIDIALQNATAAGVAQMIDFQTGDLRFSEPKGNFGTAIVNPPYGERLEVNDLMELYSQLGDHLKKSYTGFDAWVLSANFDALKKVGLRPSRKITIFNGKLETRFVKFGLYQGTKKIQKSA